MAAEETKPKRIIDREKQWRKIDAGHYVSPKGRFHATRDDDGWLVVDVEGENEPQWYGRWRDARPFTNAIEFGDPYDAAPPAIELVEETLQDEFHNTVRIRLIRGDDNLGDVVVYGPTPRRPSTIALPRLDDAMAVDVAEAFATALMLASHHAARLDREGGQ